MTNVAIEENAARKTRTADCFAIYRCKRCKKAGQQDAHRRARTRVTTWIKTRDCFRQATLKRLPENGPAPLACPGCGSELHGKWIGGVKVESIRCGYSCTNAKGGDCECACGGENHGQQWD